MRIFTTFILCILSTPLWGQNWITQKPDLYPAGKMAEEGVEMVNIYEVVQEKAVEGEENGHVVRVVRAPVRSYTFDREGNITERVEYNEETGQVRMRVEMAYGPHGIASKESRIYVTRAEARVAVDDSLNHGMKLAMRRKFDYRYDENGHLACRVVREVGNGKAVVTDSSTFVFSEDGKLLRHGERLLAHCVGGDNDYSHGENGEVKVAHRDGSRSEISLDEQGRFVSIVKYGERDLLPASEERLFYQNGKLDSTWSSYRTPDLLDERVMTMSSRYFYDKGGKLVMIRQRLPGGRVMETLHEYFYFHEHE